MDYFAYASNLSKEQMRRRCPEANPRFQAILPNYRLVFTGWSREWKGATASIIPVRGERVQGGVYEISDKDLQRLDRAEDFPNTYDRITVLVLDDSGRSTRAVTYIKKKQSDPGKPSPEYLAVIKQGYRDWGIE